jgi:ATP-binding cassette subfamily B protein
MEPSIDDLHTRVAERGRHAELLAEGGLYARLWEAQEQARQTSEPEATGKESVR